MDMNPKELKEYYKFMSDLLKQYSDIYLKMSELCGEELSKGLEKVKDCFEIGNSHYIVKREIRKNGLSILCIRRSVGRLKK